MIRAIRNLTVNIMAAFIRDRDRRHQFRSKYKIRSKFRKLRDDNRILFNENKQIRNELNKIKSAVARINEKNFCKYNQYTVQRCRKFLDIPNLEEKYKVLIDGLDDESIECVSRILSRMKLISQQDLGTDPKVWRSIDLFPPKEIEQLETLRKDYNQRVIQLSEDCYAYKHYFFPIKRISPSVFYYKHQIPNLKDLEKLKNKDFIDAGGFIGDSALIFSEYTDGNIYSFEGVSESYDLMLKTIKLNKSKNIVPIKMALGEKEEDLEIRVQGSCSSLMTDDPPVFFQDASSEIIKVTTLDKFVSENDLDVGLIKVDIEGFEQKFLKGAEQTIRKFKPTMLLSIYHKSSDFFDIKPMIESWNLGYKFKIQQPIFGHIWHETLLICECD